MGSIRLAAVLITAVLCVALSGSSVTALEKFIPKGHSYSPDEPELPPLNSPNDLLNGQADIYETEIYRQQYRLKMLDSELNRLIQHDFDSGPLSGPTY